ncbi:MAG: hypothetical protein ACTTIV_06735 [Campylobacter sp.]|jgi:hypothetical protein
MAMYIQGITPLDRASQRKLAQRRSKNLPTNSKSFFAMYDHELIQYYLYYPHDVDFSGIILRLCILENELIERGFTDIVKRTQMHNLSTYEQDKDDLRDEFEDKGLIPIPF